MYTKIYTRVYNGVHACILYPRPLSSSPLLFLGVCADPVVVSPQSVYTVCSRVLTMCALGYLHYECRGDGDYVANG